MFLINYDLMNPGQNYSDLITAIKAYGKWAKISSSCWAIKTEDTAVQIRDNLTQYIDSGDVLFVCRFSDWAAYNFSQKVVDWLKK